MLVTVRASVILFAQSSHSGIKLYFFNIRLCCRVIFVLCHRANKKIADIIPLAETELVNFLKNLICLRKINQTQRKR
jgi:hypothetical protein